MSERGIALCFVAAVLGAAGLAGCGKGGGPGSTGGTPSPTTAAATKEVVTNLNNA